MIETRKPALKIVFVNEFGDKQVIIKELYDSTAWSLTMAFKESLLGFGFHPEVVDECIESE